MSDLEARQRRLASNQALFRLINAQVRELNESFEGFEPVSVFDVRTPSARSQSS